eukprot:c17683_g1_i1.p1 GENE.c17683_g1_i1~~c17683_g1_i1.p1  ORF type:complete len:382 (-),score=58.06 c17683_g1_i1:91-1236(-)
MCWRPPPPLPKAPLLALTLAQVTQGISLFQLFSYAGFLVMHFGLSDRATAGNYAGFLASAVFVCRTVSSYPLALLYDKYGAKTALTLSLTVMGLSSLVFGLSTSFEMAVAARGVMGLFDCVLLVSKVAISDLCTHPQQEARAMFTVTFSWCSAMLVGPAVGGLLYGVGFPTFPQLAPSLVSAGMSALSVVALQCTLPDTRAEHEEKKLRERTHVSTDEVQVIGSEAIGNDAGPNAHQEIKLKDIITNRTALRAIGKFSVCALTWTAYLDVFPLWCIATVNLHGLGWSSRRVGLCYLIAGCGVIVFTVVVAFCGLTKMGIRRAFVCSCIGELVMFSLMPCIPFLVGPNAQLYWVAGLFLLQQITNAILSTALNVMTNRSVHP